LPVGIAYVQFAQPEFLLIYALLMVVYYSPALALQRPDLSVELLSGILRTGYPSPMELEDGNGVKKKIRCDLVDDFCTMGDLLEVSVVIGNR
jgi:hypothetical protein